MPTTEHMAPKRIKPKALGDYLEVMSNAVFQTGISWQVVEKKWPGTREAFKGFDAVKVSTLGPTQVDALSNDTQLIRNRRKIEAIIGNPQAMVALEQKHGNFQKYLRSHGSFDATVKDLRKQFKFLGDAGAYYFLYVVGEKVPEYSEWCKAHGMKPPKGM